MTEEKIEAKDEKDDEINWMEDDNKGDKKDEGEDEGADKKEAEKDGDKKDEDEKKIEKDKEAGDKEAGKYSPEDEVRELRTLLRDSKRQMAVMDAQLKRTDSKSTKALEAAIAAGEDEEDENGNVKAKVPVTDELSNIEKLQRKLDVIGETRGPILEILAETMAQNAQYADLHEVCSRANFDDVFDVIASEMAKDGKGNKEELLLSVEADTWSMSNPYKYMYKFIKENHPSYTGKEEDNKGDKKVMKSIAGSTGGGTDSKAGWTAAKIDALPEGQLDKVPADIYEKYISGELD